ncbi:hypothetical protein [Anaerolactibacter massiliensis]|uniref:hypothetical protein n=1 Tax=Anaerolactibacter massiliensis TaxID=2044573 RepID=UPI00107FA46F|nr:hypothetical protein [Anaerolactibacter massiliensis]
MKKVIVLLTSCFLVAIGFLVNVNALDRTTNIINFKIPASQKLAEYWIDDTSDGTRIYVTLNPNGDVQDQVNYWAVDTNENQITNYGIATENGVKTYVTYSDHKTTRFLHKVYFKSAKKNWSHYYINGVMVY